MGKPTVFIASSPRKQGEADRRLKAYFYEMPDFMQVRMQKPSAKRSEMPEFALGN